MDKLAIFDLDGTLFDTGEVNYRAYKKALEDVNLALDRETFLRDFNGRHYKEFLPLLIGERAVDIGEIHDKKCSCYKDFLGHARVNMHLFEIIKAIREEYHIAIVTTASKKNTEDILLFFGVRELFELVLTQKDVERVKPDPQGFLKAMEFFGVGAENTVIFEDSEAGIEAARASGASVMIVDKFL